VRPRHRGNLRFSDVARTRVLSRSGGHVLVGIVPGCVLEGDKNNSGTELTTVPSTSTGTDKRGADKTGLCEC
jgi:hypothetical protein